MTVVGTSVVAVEGVGSGWILEVLKVKVAGLAI